MELASIEKLVEKYDNAETTLQEEAVLREYFTSSEVAPHLQEYQMMFAYFQSNQDVTYTKNIEFASEKKKSKYIWWSVAAAIALLFSVYFGMNQKNEPETLEDFLATVPTEVRDQYVKAHESIMLLSSTLKKETTHSIVCMLTRIQ